MATVARTRQHVLAEFDRAIGLDVTLRGAGGAGRSAAAGDAEAATGTGEVPATAANTRAVRTVEPRPTAEPRPAAEPRLTAEPRPTFASIATRSAEPTPDAFINAAGWSLTADWLSDAGDAANKVARLKEIQESHDRDCPHCTTATAHTRTVFGEGNPAAEVMFVGEAPGETEDQLGRPFVGRAGQKLDEMIKAMGFRREDVYIANVLKSRPPENRTPLQHEVDSCGPYLVAQILAIRPRVLVTLGGPATKLVLAETQGITRLRGIWRSWTPPQGSGLQPIDVMPTYHPAYVLRNYTAKVRGEVWNDLKSVLLRLGKPVPGEAAPNS